MISNLENLIVFDIEKTSVQTLPESIIQLSKLQILNCQNNPMTHPREAITSKGKQAIFRFFSELIMKRA